MSALFPVVPMAPGVPNVLRNLTNFIPNTTAQVLVQDLISTLGIATPAWYLSQNGKVLVKPDNVLGIEFKKDYAISMYPIEQGNFESYNKVEVPFFLRVVMTKGGSVAERAAFLNQLQVAEASLSLYQFVTPDRIYADCSVMQVNYRRSATQGAGLLTVEVVLQEIRLQATSSYANTATPSGANAVHGGQLQGLPLPTGVSSSSVLSGVA